jgi:putative modified peptide
MSRYAINSLLYRLKKDRTFREHFNRDPQAALAGLDLSEAERAAFVARDMYRINQLGGYLHLTMSVPGMAAHVTHEDPETPTAGRA